MARGRADLRTEVMAKVLHVVLGIFIVLTYQAGILTLGVLGLIVVIIGALVLFNYRVEKELLTRLLSVGRVDAKIPGIDMLAFLAGSWIVLAIFDWQIAAASIMILTVADPLAHLISGGFGGTGAAVTERSYIYGSLAGVVGGTFAALLYVAFIPALLASAAAMAIEAGELRIAEHHIDDNFLIPISAAVVLWLISVAF